MRQSYKSTKAWGKRWAKRIGDKIMHQCRWALPRPELKEFVRAFAQREISSSSPDILQPVPASLESFSNWIFEIQQLSNI